MKDFEIIDKLIDRIVEYLLPIVKIFYKHYPNDREATADFMSKLTALALNRALNILYPDDSKRII